MLTDKRVILGITGSIAAYKAAELASQLTQVGALVDTIMTRSAQEFITPMTLRSLTHRTVVTDLFDVQSEYSVQHVALAEAADVVVIAPATANVIAKLAAGLADDMLTCTILATKAPVILAPAMNVNMYQNQITQDNLAKLQARGFVMVGPGYGRLATGLIGQGRLADLDQILGTIHQVLGREGDLAGRRIVVSAGGTQEPLDPVRVITNRSSGKMGYALAEVARDRGAQVVLVAAPTALADPPGVEVVHVQTAEEMRRAVLTAVAKADALLMAAAVADYRPATVATEKIKKESQEALTLKMERTPDILSEVGDKVIKVGFAAESEDLLENAQAKLSAKRLDLIVANDITATDSGFSVDTNRVILIDRQGKVEHLPLMLKTEVAEKVLDRVGDFLREREKRAKRPKSR